VLEEALRHGTVVPMTFGVVLPDDEAVTEELLRPRHADLLGLLAELEGRIEVRLRGYYDEESVLTEVVTEHPGLQAGATGLNERIRLGERIAGALEAKRETDAERVLSRLQPLAIDTARRQPATEMTVLDAAFLLDRDALDDFDAAVSTLGGEIGDRVRLKYVGPLPPATPPPSRSWTATATPPPSPPASARSSSSSATPASTSTTACASSRSSRAT
jgi:hypothetical protein